MWPSVYPKPFATVDGSTSPTSSPCCEATSSSPSWINPPTSVEAFIEQAANDPQVRSIRR
ncbi:MAG: hypothetical protein R2715_05960 [Ilumatobacteraceae bacterium]